MRKSFKITKIAVKVENYRRFATDIHNSKARRLSRGLVRFTAICLRKKMLGVQNVYQEGKLKAKKHNFRNKALLL